MLERENWLRKILTLCLILKVKAKCPEILTTILNEEGKRQEKVTN